MIDIEDRGTVRWMTLDRPERKNAIPPDGWSVLAEAFAAFEDSAQRVLVVTGAGGDFCSGADLATSDVGERGIPAPAAHRRMKTVGMAAATLHRLSKPTIAAVDGVAVGAGMNLALGCDVVLATTRARFSEIFVQRGLTVDFGGTWLLPRAVGRQRAMELALSGRIVDAEEALAIGLVLELHPPEQLEAAVERLAERFAAGAPVGQMFAKAGIQQAFDVSFDEALAAEGRGQTICFSTRDVLEGVSAFLQKRPPEFRGG